MCYIVLYSVISSIPGRQYKKKEKESTAERAPGSVGRRNSMPVDEEGRKG